VLDRAKRLRVGRELAAAVDVSIELAFVENELLMGLQPAQLVNSERNRRGPAKDFFGLNLCHYANTSPSAPIPALRLLGHPASSSAGGYDVKQLQRHNVAPVIPLPDRGAFTMYGNDVMDLTLFELHSM
jgi:hypothetical protein